MASNHPVQDLKTDFSFNGIGKKIIICLTILFILSVTGLVLLVLFSQVEDKSFGRSVSDTLLKIISGTLIGTLVAMLVSDYSQQQLERKNQDQYKKDVLKQLQDLYAKTKNARRLLRAKGFTTQWYGKADDACLLKQSVYDLYINDINKSQLELERIRKEIFTGKSSFRDPELIMENLKNMDTYLGSLISEYEKKLPCFKGEPAVLQIKELPDLKKFLGSAKIDDGFKINFSRRCEVITINIRDEINFTSSKEIIKVDKHDDDAEE